jgi:hypothetical protein
VSETKAQLQDRCDRLGRALDEARETIAMGERARQEASVPAEHEMTAVEEVVEDIRYGDLHELVAQLRTALPAVDLERLRKALDEP